MGRFLSKKSQQMCIERGKPVTLIQYFTGFLILIASSLGVARSHLLGGDSLKHHAIYQSHRKPTPANLLKEFRTICDQLPTGGNSEVRIQPHNSNIQPRYGKLCRDLLSKSRTFEGAMMTFRHKILSKLRKSCIRIQSFHTDSGEKYGVIGLKGVCGTYFLSKGYLRPFAWREDQVKEKAALADGCDNVQGLPTIHKLWLRKRDLALGFATRHPKAHKHYVLDFTACRNAVNSTKSLTQAKKNLSKLRQVIQTSCFYPPPSSDPRGIQASACSYYNLLQGYRLGLKELRKSRPISAGFVAPGENHQR